MGGRPTLHVKCHERTSICSINNIRLDLSLMCCCQIISATGVLARHLKPTWTILWTVFGREAAGYFLAECELQIVAQLDGLAERLR